MFANIGTHWRGELSKACILNVRKTQPYRSREMNSHPGLGLHFLRQFRKAKHTVEKTKVKKIRLSHAVISFAMKL